MFALNFLCLVIFSLLACGIFIDLCVPDELDDCSNEEFASQK